MIKPNSHFNPRQKMLQQDFEIIYKRDVDLTDVALHHHDFYEVNFLVSGDVTYVIESHVYHVSPGNMLIIGPRELHQVHIESTVAPYERYMLWITPGLLQKLSSEQTDLGHCFDLSRPNYCNLLQLSAQQQQEIPALMEGLIQEQEHPVFGSDLRKYNFISELLIRINRMADSADMRRDNGALSIEAQVIEYINMHYHQPITLDVLAEHLFVSKYHLSHEFKKQVGISVYQYLQKKRLLIARQLMAQGRKPVDVYEVCGFRDYTAFYRAFQKVYGLSPREYVQSSFCTDQVIL